MHRHGIFHPCRQNLLVRDASPRDFSSLQTESSLQGCITPGFFIPANKISSAGIECIASGFFIPADKISSARMHRPRIFHPCRQNPLVRDASPQDFSSLQTESSRQGCIAPGFFILADRIPSSGMHRPGIFILADRIFSSGMHHPRIFHPCRQNLLVRDASPRDFSSLQTESPRQGCIVSAIMPQACRAPPQSAELTSIHLNACRAYPDKAGSSDFQTAGFHSR